MTRSRPRTMPLSPVAPIPSMSLKRTPLFAAHQQLGGKLIEFGGWEMPVQYTSIVEEHHAVRRAAGVFDISHMGEVWFEGPQALAFLNGLLTNDLRKLPIGLGQYTHLCLETGGTIDDLYAYRVAEETYLLVINAGRIDADVAWLEARWNAFPDRAGVRMDHVSATTGAIAIQGPRVAEFIDTLFPGHALAGATGVPASALAKNQIGRWDHAGQTVWVARTGYTGEDGFEISVAPSDALALADKLLSYDIVEWIGLGARDSLRLEAGLCLYGHDMDVTTSPVEAGILWSISKSRRVGGAKEGGFLGAEAIFAQIANGVAKKRVGFLVDGRAPVREGAEIVDASGAVVGAITSGGFGPTLQAPIAMGYVPTELAAVGTQLNALVRGVARPITVAKMPLVEQRYYRG